MDNNARQLTLTLLKHLFKDHPLFFLSLEKDFDPYLHQAEAFYRLLYRRPVRALVADEVGLGKTIITGMILRYLLERGLAKKALIVVPRSLLEQWRKELQRFRSNVNLNPIPITSRDDFNKLSDESGVFITKVDFIKRKNYKDNILEHNFDLIIVDEAHRIGKKGSKESQRYELLKALVSKNRNSHVILLTATPHRGKEDDYLSRLYLVDNYIATNKPDYRFYLATRNAIIIRRSKKLINEAYEDDRIFVNASLTNVIVKPTEEEKKFYDEIDSLTRQLILYHANVSKERAEYINLLAALIDKRSLSSPDAALNTLSTVIENRISSYTSDEDVIKQHLEEDSPDVDDVLGGLAKLASSFSSELKGYKVKIQKLIQLASLIRNNDSKLRKVTELVDKHLKKGDKVIVFSEYVDTSKYIYDNLKEKYGSDSILLLNSEVLQKKKIEDIKEQLKKDSIKVLVATDVASEGLNLQMANVVINYELPWSPVKLEQRLGRVWRLGQKKDVQIYNVMIDTRVEKNIFRILYQKLITMLGAGINVQPGDSIIYADEDNEVRLDINADLDTLSSATFKSEDISSYQVYMIAKNGDEMEISLFVKEVMEEIQNMKSLEKKLGLTPEYMRDYIKKFLRNIIGFQNRKDFFNTIASIHSAVIGTNGYLKKKNVEDVYKDLVGDLVRVSRSLQTDSPLVLKCKGYKGKMIFSKVCIKDNEKELLCTFVTVKDGKLLPLKEGLEELLKMGKCEKTTESVNDNPTILRVFNDEVFSLLYDPLYEYRRVSGSMRSRDNWFPNLPSKRLDPNFTEIKVIGKVIGE